MDVQSAVHTSRAGLLGEYDIECRDDHHGGQGVFATRDIHLRSIILTARDIRVKANSDARLEDACYFCQVGRDDEPAASMFRTPEIRELKLCSGCKTVRYCSATCQKSSWSEVHQYECKIFRKLAPRVLPSNVRAVMRMLLLHKANKLIPGEWDEIISLRDHLKEWQEVGGETWQSLCLSAKAAKAYSGSRLDDIVVMRLFGILMTNSFSMVTPTYDPAGVALHPLAALLNHSCDYNATVRFSKDGNRLEVIPIRPIKKGEEITICYIDEVLPLKERQAELKERYFFDCKCPKCTAQAGSPAPTPLSAAAQSAYETAISRLQSKADNPIELTSIFTALHNTSTEPTNYPLPSLCQRLVTDWLTRSQYNLAFVYAMLQSFQLDPIVYPRAHHPIRMVHAWLCARIIDQILDGTAANQVPQDLNLGIFGIDMGFWRCAIVVSLHRSAKVTAEGDFSRMVDARYNEDKSAQGGSDKSYQAPYCGKEALETKWAGVQKAIDYVMKNEKGN